MVDLRRRRGLTLRQAAVGAGISAGYLSMLESGLRPPPADEALARIASVLCTSRAEEGELCAAAICRSLPAAAPNLQRVLAKALAYNEVELESLLRLIEDEDLSGEEDA